MANITEQDQLILNCAKERGLFNAFHEYASIFPSPKPYFYSKNAGNKYTPIGRVMVKNLNYNKEVTLWKKQKLFPWFMEQKFDKKDLNEAWAKWVKKYKH
jgi:hypothetical protein